MENAKGAAAVLYKDTANVQHRDGRRFIEDISPKPGDTVLDIGCGTGGVTAYLAKVVGHHGKVRGVDPDGARIKLAHTNYQQMENLTFVEGSCVQFPDVGLEKYDLIFSSYVFHWIFDKEEAIKTAYRSLKPGGRIALQFGAVYPPLIKKALAEIYPENTTEPVWYEKTETLEHYFQDAGFNITKLHHYTSREYFDSLFEFCTWSGATSHSREVRVDRIIRERLEKFVPPMEDGKIVLEIPLIQIVGTK